MTAKQSENDAHDEPEIDPLQRACGVCGAQPGNPCLDVAPEDGGDGRPMPRGVYHVRRCIPGTGPVRVRHTGTFDADGGGVFEVVPPEGGAGGGDEGEGNEGEHTAGPAEAGEE